MADIDLTQARAITTQKEKQYGLPDGTLFKIGGIESSFKSGAVSPKGAQGYFQFMPDTAKAYGLKDPSNFEESADAAARYMRDNLKKYNGNIDLSLADYNGGPKAAQALARGKPWSETSDYLSKFHGGGYAPLSGQFTTGDSIRPSFSPSASELYKQEQQRNAEYGGFVNNVANFPSAVAQGFQLDNSVYNYWKEQGLKSVDPNFIWTEDIGKQMLDGIPQKHWEYVLQAKSEQEARDRRARTMSDMEKELDLAKKGVAGFTGRLVGGLADIPTLLAFVPGAGGEALLSTTSRVANAVRMGLVGAASNVAFDAATMGNRPTATVDDLYISATMGLALGGLGGAAVSPARVAQMRLADEIKALRDFGMRESLKAQTDEFNKLGFELTDEGKKIYQRLDEQTRKASAEIKGNIDRQSELMKREFKFEPSNDNVIKDNLIEETKIIPEFDRGRMMLPEYGAEELTRNFLERFKAAEVGKRMSLDDFIDNNFEFFKNGKIKKSFDPTGKLTKNDLEQVGITTRADVENLVNRIALDQNYDNIVRFATKGSGREILTKLSQSTDPAIASLAKRLGEQIIGDVPVFTVRQRDIDLTFPHKKAGSFDGFYSSNRHAVFVKENPNEGTMLHELLHAVTVHKLDYGLKNPNTVHGQMATELQSIFERAKALADQQGFKSYYLQNVKEFTAGLYTGRTSRSDAARFQDFLAKMKDDSGQSYIAKVVDVFRKLLGLDQNETNMLLKSLDLTDRLIDERLTVKMDYGKNVGVETIHFAPASVMIGEDIAIAASRADVAPVFGWGLGLENRLGNAQVPQAVRNLAAKLFGTTVGYKGHSVVKSNAWDDTTKWADSWAVELRKGTYPAFEDWFKKSGKSWTEKGAAFEDFGNQVSNYIRGIEADYPSQVVKAGEAMRKQLAKVVDYINNPLLDEGGSKKGLTMQEIRDPETGTVTLVGGLDKNPYYLPRKHDVNKWNSLVQTYGRDAVEGWWARAHLAGRQGISEEQAAKFGKWYVRAVEDAHANRTQDLLDDLIRGQDMEGLKQSLKINGGFSDAEVTKIIDDLFPTKASDTGRTMASLKNRNTIDEKYSETWTLPDGTKVEVGLNQFVHTNAFDIVEPYLRRTAGSVAMAKNLDVYKVGDIDRLIGEATENKLGTDFKNKADVQRMREDLQFAFDRIQGLPQEEFTWWRKGLDMWRNFNVIRLMGGAVWNQATELSQTVGSMGWKATLAAVPELRALKRDIATGKAPNDILDHLENTIGGVGSEYVARMDFKGSDDWVRNLGDTKMNQWLDRIDNGVKAGAKGVLDYTGMTPLMIQQKRLHAVALVNHFVNKANGKIDSKFLTKDRLAWMGLDDADTTAVMDSLKTYTKPAKGEYADTFKLDVNKWVKENPETHSKFMNAIHRESRRVVQENDLASMIPLMGGTLGKTVFQFMNFSMHGWNKSLMFAANHKDWTTLSTVMHGSFLASLAYMGRTMTGAIGMDSDQQREYLDKRLAPGQIVANSFGRISQMSLIPNIYDTLSPYPAFNGMRTTSDLSSLASNPTYQAVNGLLSMKKIIRNATSDELQTTSQDVKAWGKLLPLNNVFPVSTLLNSIANDYPNSDKEQ